MDVAYFCCFEAKLSASKPVRMSRHIRLWRQLLWSSLTRNNFPSEVLSA